MDEIWSKHNQNPCRDDESTVFRALADPTRRRVLELLKAGPMSAGELAALFGHSKPTMSAHFAVLREAGLVDSEEHGKNAIYHLQISVLEDALLIFARAFRWGMAQRTLGVPQ